MFYVCLLLYFGRTVLIPLSFAVLISFILYPVCVWFQKRGVGRLVAIIMALAIVMLMVMGLLWLLVSQFLSFVEEWPSLQTKITQAIAELSRILTESFGLSLERQRALLSSLSDQSGSNLLTIVRNTVSASAGSLVMVILIPVYVVLILHYRQHWMRILGRIFPDERPEELRGILRLTIQTYYNFIKGMAVVYLLVGLLNSIGLLLLGIPHAFLFGFIASILTFVPYVGIMIGSLLPITLAWVTYDSLWYPVGIVAIFTFVQYLEANLIFPLAVSKRLQVNTLVTLVAIFVGGLLWGVSGMILFVPFVAIVKLIADHNPRWKSSRSFSGRSPRMMINRDRAAIWRSIFLIL